ALLQERRELLTRHAARWRLNHYSFILLQCSATAGDSRSLLIGPDSQDRQRTASEGSNVHDWFSVHDLFSVRGLPGDCQRNSVGSDPLRTLDIVATWHVSAANVPKTPNTRHRMKIVKLEDFHADGGWDTYSFLKITTDEGVTGWSE